ncbi:MAG: UDP-N-acetylmuramate:L-alanyl-gamma-D-glutamyl-meso-diaminopimelate ligase [Gammaproteobacteria bacterium]|nr:UDP-N-acetylmuramate:L-alanyl-gamma-D-glutamyl-meso-diaminopimelate ligase [Gammaproteobacteria bacterium]
MHIHILGICGTFMGGVALLAREKGFKVTGCDAAVYPPMSTQLEEQGIELIQGYSNEQFSFLQPDLVVIGNAMSRGNEAVEYVLNNNLAYTSGPEFVSRYVLQDKWVLAVAGTHGKTTTSSMLAWILEAAGMKPGFLIGGVAENFSISARLGDSDFFVIEADEYDTAFFDKRSKFVHYRPRSLILNNLEFDHADIFKDLHAIQTQFHHLVRIVPQQGLIVCNSDEENLSEVLAQGCWTPVENFSQNSETDWSFNLRNPDGSSFDVLLNNKNLGSVVWPIIGLHNVSNAISAIAAARHAGVPVSESIQALSEFKTVKRRMELLGDISGIKVYDDFAHHPTAIETTLHGLRQKVGKEKIIAILEPRSNTMKLGVHKDTLAASVQHADSLLVLQSPDISWSADSAFAQAKIPVLVFQSVEDIIESVVALAKPGDHILIMSNGGFENIHQRLLQRLESL